ncbi:MAG: tRNA (adenosine(37)-N6)-threonylcarbamoyltransferase complex ATPase subunit type 1 TsaE [Limnobacter sp.]|nr:tRNA (adenosine(37)-N6)-threonylcarbamoyltransferase complex ATPase subunit type 1 TsaE [Limnobacter sp.]
MPHSEATRCNKDQFFWGSCINEKLSLNLPSDQATQSVGQNLAQCVQAPLVIFLSGPLGAGKSTLSRAFLREQGITGLVKSPTYSLVEPYTFSGYSIYHFDFYRFFDENEWEDSGFRDFFEENAICLVEWPEKAKGVLPKPDLDIKLEYLQNPDSGLFESRRITLKAMSEQGERAVACMESKHNNEHT